LHEKVISMSFKIHSLTTYSKGQNLVIVKALTDSGIAGYGECSGMYASATIDITSGISNPPSKG